jgi:UDP-GlcNAc:undecaprenyl-phosphate/decaprenyl-phosphate GlcNAc-1-phosphate transferase
VILDLFGGAAIAALTSLIACRALITAGPIDRPSLARHEHTSPTPTSGGLGIALGFAAGLITLAFFFPHIIPAEMSTRGATLLSISASFAYAFLLIGFWDDTRPLNAPLKFALFAALAIGATLTVGAVDAFPFGAGAFHAPYWLALSGTALWIFVLVNAVNFMDGANGLAMGSVGIGLIALGAVSFTHGSSAGVAICLCAVGALLGFLYWNFPSGKLFAGDSGALFIGALAALASLIVIHRTGLSPLVPAIIFFPLLADVLVTLAWRVYRRHSLLDGHSEHIYQILIRGGMSHAEIALTYWAAMAVCGGVGFLVARDQGVAPWVALPIMAFLAIVISAVVRRFADRRGVGGV